MFDVFSAGYSKNFYRKDDEILVFHVHEVPSLPATPYPCKVTLYLIKVIFSFNSVFTLKCLYGLHKA